MTPTDGGTEEYAWIAPKRHRNASSRELLKCLAWKYGLPELYAMWAARDCRDDVAPTFRPHCSTRFPADPNEFTGHRHCTPVSQRYIQIAVTKQMCARTECPCDQVASHESRQAKIYFKHLNILLCVSVWICSNKMLHTKREILVRSMHTHSRFFSYLFNFFSSFCWVQLFRCLVLFIVSIWCHLFTNLQNDVSYCVRLHLQFPMCAHTRRHPHETRTCTKPTVRPFYPPNIQRKRATQFCI